MAFLHVIERKKTTPETSWPPMINGNFRILKWRYVSTIFLAIFCGDIHLHRPEKKALYMVGTSILGSWNSHWSWGGCWGSAKPLVSMLLYSLVNDHSLRSGKSQFLMVNQRTTWQCSVAMLVYQRVTLDDLGLPHVTPHFRTPPLIKLVRTI